MAGASGSGGPHGSLVSTGIAIHHAPRAVAERSSTRLDHAGFVGVVVAERWPSDAAEGDVVEVEVTPEGGRPADGDVVRVDALTRRSVEAFLANGGVRATVLGVCVVDPIDLVDAGQVERLLGPLLERLRHDDDVSLLLAPAMAALPSSRGTPGAHAVAVELLRHARQQGDRFVLLDPPADADEAEVVAWIARLRAEPSVDPSYGALYFPWLHQGDVRLPPSGAVAGVHARLLRDGGIAGLRRAPANVDLRGFTHPRVELGWTDAPALVDAGIDPVVVQAGRGLVVAGARTLSDDPRWRTILARRIVSYVAARVRRDAEWVVFEHLRPELWDAVARSVRARLDELWRAGLLTGRAAGDEYVVRCDAETNPPAVRDRGEVHVRVLLRPVSATEFVEIDLQLAS
jgi:hypothetical protein